MKNFLGVLLALGLLRVQGKKPTNGYCVAAKCFTLYTDTVDFNSARKSCQDKGGHLMTVRTPEADTAISDLLTGVQGHFWIGLRYASESCADSSLDLKGYTWITGDRRTNFTNWKSSNKVCAPRCVSLSKDDLKWTERHCNNEIEGYLCEHNNALTCERLRTPVLYETPFGFSREDLIEVPEKSNATHKDLGKFICAGGTWHRAPWNCDVYKGGCEHSCSKWNELYVCTCPPGYRIQFDAVSCSKATNDPCLQAGCSHECLATVDDYECLCHPGFKLSENGKTCKDIDECDDDRMCPGPNVQCINTDGSFECRCRTGFRKTKNNCEDYDECQSGPCEHMCINTEGSYYCECGVGYKVAVEDRNKCVPHCPDWECPAVACDPNNPSQCYCPRGFILEERLTEYFCVDIDECEMFYCDQNCNNTAGGYICSCDEGFSLTGNNQCVPKDIAHGLITTPTTDVSPTSRSPTLTPMLISAGGLLAICACIIVGILLVGCIVYCAMRQCGKDRYKFHNEDMHHLQQVTTERYSKSVPNKTPKE